MNPNLEKARRLLTSLGSAQALGMRNGAEANYARLSEAYNREQGNVKLRAKYRVP